MKHRTRTALGIEVAENGVSVALVRKHRQGYDMIAGGTIELPACDSKEAGAIRARNVSRLVSHVRRRASCRGLKMAMAVSSSPMVMQLLDLPKPIPANVGDFVQRELRQYVSLSGREIVSDFCGIGTGSGQGRRLLAVAADKKPIQDAIELCGGIGGMIQAVEPAILSCARALLTSVGGGHRGDNHLVAMLGTRELTISAFRRGSVDFCRIRSTPKGTAKPEILCRWVAEELRAVTRYYEIEGVSACDAWHAWLVLDESAHAPEHLAFLEATEVGMRSLTILDPRQAPPEVCGTPARGPVASTAAVGAAMRVLLPDSEGPQVNLLPGEVTQGRRASRHILIAANVAALVFLAIFLSTQILTQVTGTMQDRIKQSKLAAHIYATPALVAQEKYLDSELTRIARELAGLHMVLTRERTDWPSVLELIGRASPTDVSVTQVASGDGRRVAVKGCTLSCDAAEAFAQRLELGGPFESVSLSRIQRAQHDSSVMEYQIDCTLKGRK